MKKGRYIFGLLAAVLIILIFLLLWKRSSESEDWPEQSVKPTPAETALRGHQEREPVARAAYADTLKAHARYLALTRERDSLKAQLSSQRPKAQQSAQEFQKTPTFDNCVQALNDCQEESETQRYALAVQDRMLAAADTAKRKDRNEIARSYAVNDSLMAGWDNANKALRKAQKPRPWSIGLQGGYGAGKAGFGPYIGIGVQYSILRF